ncbi:hypothetical protein TNCV_4290791 [Trichonephila clavipes]|nr:hypothetical protein TNCV_4290791 [Trichonephila clavipes]
MFSEHDFAAAKTTNHDIVGDATEINSANPQTLSLSLWRKSIKSRPSSSVASISKNGVIICPACEEEYCDPPTEEWIQSCKCQEWWHEENGIFICDYC